MLLAGMVAALAVMTFVAWDTYVQAFELLDEYKPLVLEAIEEISRIENNTALIQKDVLVMKLLVMKMSGEVSEIVEFVQKVG